jgi:hypothetical protein
MTQRFSAAPGAKQPERVPAQGAGGASMTAH